MEGVARVPLPALGKRMAQQGSSARRDSGVNFHKSDSLPRSPQVFDSPFDVWVERKAWTFRRKERHFGNRDRGGDDQYPTSLGIGHERLQLRTC